jgi:hypothetical protein
MRESFIDTLTPETRLLVCCARTRLPPAVVATVRLLAASRLDWDAVIRGADRNAIVPLVYRHLGTIVADAVPPGPMTRLSEASRSNTLRCLNLTSALIDVLRQFSAQGINALPYKGPVLAMQAYEDVSLRQFNDVDVVLRQRDMAKAHQAMLQLGYAAKFPGLFSSAGFDAEMIPGEYKYHSEARGAIVELHTESTLRHFPVPLDFDDVYSRSALVKLSGHEVRTFCPEDTLIAICVHGTKDLWERLSWIADIAGMLESGSTLNWREIQLRAEVLRVERMVNVGLALAAGVLDATIPGDIAANADEDHVARVIANRLAGNLLSFDCEAIGARERFHLRRRLVGGTLAGWRYASRLTMAPAEEDWNALRLPRSLAPLYALLRPIRLFWKYGRSRETL